MYSQLNLIVTPCISGDYCFIPTEIIMQMFTTSIFVYLIATLVFSESDPNR